MGSLGLHALPFLNGPHPLGYDTGFYRRYLIEPLLSFPNTVVPGLGDEALVPRAVLDLLRLAHLPTDVILYGSYIVITALLPVLLYVFLRPSLGRGGAVVTGIFLILSSVAYNAYWYLLWKNLWALCLILLAFIALERRAFWPVIALDICIALSHKTSAIVYLLTLVLLTVLYQGRRREILAHIFITGAVFALVNMELVHQTVLARPQAVFLEWSLFILLSFPFLLIISFGWRSFLERKVPVPLVAFLLVCFSYTLFHLPFYQRIFVYSDVALVALAGFGFMYLFDRVQERTRYSCVAGTVLCISVGLLLGNLWSQFRMLQPLMREEALSEISTTTSLLPQGATLLTSAEEAPWFQGFTHAHIAAPGLLHDTHNFEEWLAFWEATSTPAKIDFLNSFEQPLYVSTFGDITDVVGEPPPCLQQVSPHLYYSACE